MRSHSTIKSPLRAGTLVAGAVSLLALGGPVAHAAGDTVVTDARHASVVCDDGAIVTCFADGQQIDCARRGALHPALDRDDGLCGGHGGVADVGSQPYGFECALPSAGGADALTSPDPDFMKPCDVRELCKDGSSKCDASSTLTLVGGFPDLSVDDLVLDEIGLAHNAELDRMMDHVAALRAGGVLITDEVLVNVMNINSRRLLGDDGAALKPLVSELNHLAFLSNGEIEAELLASCHPGDDESGGCTPALIDFRTRYPLTIEAGMSQDDVDAMVANVREAAYEELSGGDLDVTLASASVAEYTSRYWRGHFGLGDADFRASDAPITMADIAGAALGAKLGAPWIPPWGAIIGGTVGGAVASVGAWLEGQGDGDGDDDGGDDGEGGGG